MLCQFQISFKNANLHKNIEYMLRVRNFSFFFIPHVYGKKHRKIDAFLLFLQLIFKQENENT